MKNGSTAEIITTDYGLGGNVEQILLDSLPCVALIMRLSTKEVLAANSGARRWINVTGEGGYTPCLWRVAPIDWGSPVEQHYSIELDGVYWDMHWRPMADDRCLLYAFDNSDRVRTETVLRNTMQGLDGYRKLFMQMPEAAFIVSPEGMILDVNDTASAQLGYRKPELIGKPVTLLYDPESHSSIIGDGVVHNQEVSIRTKDNIRRTVLLNTSQVCGEDGKVIHTVSLQNDITEIKRHEEEAQRCRKLESLGHLAGGIAHDFNNLLGGIYGYIDLAGAKTADERVVKYLGKALSTIERAKTLTRQLLTFAKGGAPVKRRDRVFSFVKERAEAVLAGSNVVFECSADDSLWECECDRNQIGQVIENLVLNAVQAMPDGGHLFVEATNVTLDDNEHLSLCGGKYLQIVIKDTGLGMPLTMLPHLFDPFYSTKPKCRGLGLATSYSIVNRHGGGIDVDSRPGEGCVFTIYLPAVDDVERVVSPITESQFDSSGVMVVVDDEEIMRETIGEMLKTIGYSVVTMEEGGGALRYITNALQEGVAVAGCIVDLTIPGGMGGEETVTRLRAIAPSMPVLVSSGYADDPVMADPRKYGFTASIAKPFRRNDLLKLLAG